MQETPWRDLSTQPMIRASDATLRCRGSVPWNWAAMNDGRHGFLPMAAMAVTCLLWGTMVPFTAELFATMNPLFFSALRYPLGVGAMCLLVLLVERRLFHPAPVPVLKVLALGGFGMAGWGTLYVIGVYLTDAITASAVLATGPVVAALVGRVLTGEKLQPRVMVGIALAVAGGITVALGRDGGAGGFKGGEIVLVIALACWAWYSTQAQRWLAPLGLSQVRLTLWTLSSALLWVEAIYFAAWGLGLAPPPAGPTGAVEWAMMIWIGFGATGLAIWFWNYGASRLGTTIATVNINLVPVIAVATAMALGRMPTLLQVIGGCLVIAGVLWVQFGGKRR